jgi:hypothetical protein
MTRVTKEMVEGFCSFGKKPMIKTEVRYLETKYRETAARVEHFGNGVYAVSRKPQNRRTGYVNLGRDFSVDDVENIASWLRIRDERKVPSWEDWQKFIQNFTGEIK